MNFTPPLKPARLIKRYKRFLADVVTPEGETFTLHCANTGAMTGCATPGDTVWYFTSDNPKRKYAHSWELTETAQGHWICVNTLRANHLVHEALLAQRIPELAGYHQITPEVKYGTENSRIDLLLQAPGQINCYIEVKSVTLLQQTPLHMSPQQGFFPDALTQRGKKTAARIDAGGRKRRTCSAVFRSTALWHRRGCACTAHRCPLCRIILRSVAKGG